VFRQPGKDDSSARLFALVKAIDDQSDVSQVRVRTGGLDRVGAGLEFEGSG
jgi:hypothetical protein